MNKNHFELISIISANWIGIARAMNGPLLPEYQAAYLQHVTERDLDDIRSEKGCGTDTLHAFEPGEPMKTK
jgi:hypothetical protein